MKKFLLRNALWQSCGVWLKRVQGLYISLCVYSIVKVVGVQRNWFLIEDSVLSMFSTLSYIQLPDLCSEVYVPHFANLLC